LTTTLFSVSAQRHGSNNEKNYIKAGDKEGNTALHLAVQNGSFEVGLQFQFLIPQLKYFNFYFTVGSLFG
jgi:ankyrin repeat protein